jgi:hypothetical protein
MAKGTHVLMYQRAIEGIALALTEAWNKYNDPKVPEKQKPAYLRLTKECNESMFGLTANGPSVMAMVDLTRRANRLGLYNDNNNHNIDNDTGNSNDTSMVTEQEQIRNYISNNNPRLDDGNNPNSPEYNNYPNDLKESESE